MAQTYIASVKNMYLGTVLFSPNITQTESSVGDYIQQRINLHLEL